MAIEDKPEESALHFDVTVGQEGRLEIVGPFRVGQRLTVLVIQQSAAFHDLADAAASSLGFWDNPLDDEDWNASAAG